MREQGTVSFVEPRSGAFGFVMSDNASLNYDLFLHVSELNGDKELRAGRRVEFDLAPNSKKPGKMRCVNARLI